jgi:uncharacterized protein (TIGR02466 family)
MKRGYDQIFPTPIMIVDFAQDELNLEECNKLLQTQVADDYFQTNRSFVSDDGLYKLLPFKKIVSAIECEVTHYCNHMLLMNKQDLKMVSMWANVHRGKSVHNPHVHSNAFLSGVLYLSIPDRYLDKNSNAGNISFEDPRISRFSYSPDYTDPFDVKTASHWEYKPTNGKLILFPGYLRHRVHEFDSGNNYRISISFNYMLIRSTQSTMSFSLE